MARKPKQDQTHNGQLDLFNDWFVGEPISDKPIVVKDKPSDIPNSVDEARYLLALRLAQQLIDGNEITSKLLTDESNRAFGGSQASGVYSSKDSYDALEAAFNIYLLGTEDSNWAELDAVAASDKASALTDKIQRLPTQTRRDDEMDEYQQFSTPPALAFVANWVANVSKNDMVAEPSAGTGDLAVWPLIAGADLILNELSPRRHTLLAAIFPKASLFKENAEQLDNVLSIDLRPSVVVMNPPFSSTAGRVQGQRDTSNGARHLEQALRRLDDGGRLVAIVGNGMASDRPAFRNWWADIEKKYNVRANVGISGREYAKYGTTFDNQILVIDKTGATTSPVLTGRVESVADLPVLLEGIRNDRKRIQSTLTQPTSRADSESVQDNVQSGGRTRGISISEDRAREKSSGNRPDNGTGTTDSETGSKASDGDVSDDGIRTGGGIPVGAIGGPGGSGGADIGGNSGVSTSGNTRSVSVRSKAEEDRLFDVLLTTLVFDPKAAKEFSQATGVIVGTANQTNQALKQWRKAQRKLKPDQRINIIDFIPDDFQRQHKIGQYAKNPANQNSNQSQSNSPSNVVIETKTEEKTEFTDSVFANYTPQRLTISGACQHPGKLVQSAAMSAVEPPAPTYSPVLPSNVITDGLLSIAQLESVVYAGQAHSETLPSGSRRGFFIGDGTGVGKGREISGIILDNMMQGRKKAVWVSFNEGLIEDARRDFAGVGGDPSVIFFQGKTKAGAEISQKEGILFTTYSTLRAGEKKQANDLGQTGGKSRAQQIIDWLGADFDGVIAFDEAHSMGNAIAVRGKRGVRKPSQQAIAGINLQKELPNARITYVSATGATEISNLSYADRLGLWGEGTPFADTTSFIGDIAKGGIAAMELISRDMKSMGMYLARSLSYDGVSYERLEHTLTDLQEDIYNELAGAWQIVLNNVEEALEITQAGKNGNGKSAAMSQFWGAHQRFFNQIITAMQTPSVIDDIRNQLDADNVAVIQLVNTNEAAQERIIANATANNAALEDLDFTPRQMLMDYVRNGFPVAAYEESTDDNGNTVYLPVKDSEGNPVFDREAIRLRDALLENLQNIRVPENPLDSIINAFGPERVAEITGRGRRFVQVRDDDGEYRIREEKRNKNSSRHDAEAFQAGKKDILVFSGAGGTGYSFHADNTAENKRKRVHYILQPGWKADSAVQGFGRTHRTNQAQEPHYVLPTTNLKAQKRFISSIARRLDQLGALTRGQREATSQGMFTASDNLESEYATTALNNFFGDLYRNKTSLGFMQVTKQMGLDLLDENGTLSETKVPGIPQFLNRLLSLKTDMQNAVFDEFEHRLIEAVEYAKQRDLYDVGLQTLTAKSIVKTRDDIAYQEERTGAKTRYIELAVTNDIEYLDWSDTSRFKREHPKDGDLSGWFVAEFGKNKGEVFYMTDIGERLDPEGKSVHRGVVHSIRANSHRYIDNADQVSRGWDYRTIGGQYQKVTLTKAITEAEAETLWKEQVAKAPKTEMKTERMIVGVILPIWDRVEGSEKIYRLQTDDGEQLLGRMLGPKAAKQTLKNLGLDSGVTNMSTSDLFTSIQQGKRAILSNGWEISIAKVNFENRIEIKGRSSFTAAEKSLLKEQGAFSERINWADRVFIPNDATGLPVFERITASKPVVDLLERKRTNDENQASDDEVNQGVPQSSANQEPTGVKRPIGGFSPDRDKPQQNDNSDRQEVVMTDSTKKRPYHEIVAENLIKQLKEGTAPWQRPWDASAAGSFLPYNPTTGNRYKGINALHLMAQDRIDQRWLTYKQASALDAQVRKGEKGTGIQYWKFTEEQTKKDDYGKPVLDEDGRPVKITVKLERPRVFFATVFNGEQIDGLPPIEKKEQTWDPIERAENILTASGANIQHNGGERAFYRPLSDSIHLPDRGLFPSADNYYATALHELGHWTGHDSRLDRDILHPFGSEGYAKEELRAEIFSMIIGDDLGIGHDPSQHVAYVGSWIKALEDDPMEIFRAAADAEKIQGFVLGLEQQHTQEQERALAQTATPADLTKAEYQRLQAAEEAYHRELVRVYGEDGAADARYEPGHEDSSAQAAKKEFQAASKALHEAITEARKTVSEGNGSLANEDIAMTEHQQDGENARKDFVLASDQLTFWNGEGWSWHDEAKRYDDPATAFKEALSLERLEREHLEDSVVMLYEHDHESKTFNLTVTTALMSNKPALRNRWMKHFGEECPEEILAAKTERGNTEDVTHENAISPSDSRTYINVPYKEKDEAKNLGARWDRQERSWFIPLGVDSTPFAKWTIHQNESSVTQAAGETQSSQPQNEKRIYLAVPYGERKAAKAAGALWDKDAKSWYVGPSADMEKLERWKPDNVSAQQGPAMTPREEFAEAMRSLGFIVSDGHPIMDGKKHRVAVEGDKTGEQAGFYVGHLDGHPAGYIKNNRTGIDMKWKSKGYSLDPQEKAKLQAEAAEKLAARAAEQERVHEATAQRVSRQTANLVSVSEQTSYLRDKGIQPHAGTLTDAGGQKTYIPAIDVDGKQWTMQYIQEDGTKRFAKDSRKEGCFHVIGGVESLDQAPALVISEGYATAATNAEALGFATVAAFDSGNLPAVAKALHEKFPDKPIIIAGDDDRNRLLTDGINPGRSKAEEAAKAVNGTAIFPIFAPGENVYPPNLESFTPQQYREHDRAMRRLEAAQKEPEAVKLSDQEVIKLQNALLSSEQIDALDKMKAHTDFNDLATRSQLGRNGLNRQVKAALSQALQAQEQRLERKQDLEQTKELKRVQDQRPKRAARIG